MYFHKHFTFSIHQEISSNGHSHQKNANKDLKHQQNGVLLRRFSTNLGEEDFNLSADEDADDEGTLLRKNNDSTLKKSNSIFKSKQPSRINGTSEKPSKNKSQNSSPQKDGTKVAGVHKILEKGKASLSRSKSELGEQHKKMISHWSRSRNEISEQNRKLLANIEQKFKGSGNSGTNKSSKNGSLNKNNESTSPEIKNSTPNNNDLDGLMKNLGLDNKLLMSASMYVEGTSSNTSNNDLEKHLENDYGEFEFIDEGATLTRTLKTNGETVNTDEHRKSMFSFSEEVFDELEKAGTLKTKSKEPYQSGLGDRGNGKHKGIDLMENYETYGAWRQRKRQQQQNSSPSSAGLAFGGLYYTNNNNSVTKNTSAKLQALIADQTLLLRHHKR